MSKFKPGRSGNPNGRPRGARSTVTALRKELISDGDLQAIVDVVIGKAKAGDLAAAGMILDRRLPRLRLTADMSAEKNLEMIVIGTGVSGGLVGGADAAGLPDDEPDSDRLPVPPPVTDPVSRAIAHAREGFESTTHARTREEATAFCQPLKGATEQTAAPVSAGIAHAPTREATASPAPPPAQAIRLRPMTSTETGADFDPYRQE